MFIPGCPCCGTTTTQPECSCACASGNPIPTVLNFTISTGTPTAVSGLTTEQVNKIRQLIDGRFCATTGGGDCSPSWSGTIVPTSPPTITRYDQGGITFNVAADGSGGGDPCTKWKATASTHVLYFGTGLDGIGSQADAIVVAGVGQVSVTAESFSTESIKQVYGLCGLTAQTQLTSFLAASAAYFRATVALDGGGTGTVDFKNATITVGRGCPVCACISPCSRSATLNGVTYDCLPPEINVDLSLVHNEGTFPDEGVSGRGAAFVGSVTTAINSLPAMTLPLVSWTGNAATYQYDYPLYTTTYLRYEVTLYCSTVCQPAQSLTAACVKAWLINKSTATPTPDPAWPVTSFTVGSGSFSKTVSDLRIYYSGNWADGDQIATPTLTINSVCTNGATTSTYDASGAQDLVSGTSITAGTFAVGGNNIPSTIYFGIAHLTVSVP